jgi:ketosteroid isomerase-like protein
MTSGPAQVSEQLVALLAQGDVDGIMDLYEEDAVFAEIDGVSRGAVEIRQAHERFLDSGLTLTLQDSVTFEMGELALVHWSWTVYDRQGSSVSGVSAEVLRRQPDGAWKFVLDNSDGAALVGLT